MKYFKIGEISKLYGISRDILRYYEREGLLLPEKRGENGYRYYSNKQIWKLGTIRALRNLGVGLDNIKKYLKERNISTTNDLIEFQLDVANEKLKELSKLKRDLKEKKSYLESIKSITCNRIEKKNLPERRCYKSYKSVVTDWEIDLELKKLKYQGEKNEGEYFATRRIGAILDKSGFDLDLYNVYEGTLLLDKSGDSFIKGGEYLICYYRGGYQGVGEHYKSLKNYIRKNDYEVDGEVIEIFEVDICETEDENEFLTQLQIPVKKNKLF